MNLKKAQARFNRAWEKVTAGKVVPHVRVVPVAEEDQSTADLILQFDAIPSIAVEEYAVRAGCTSLGCFGMTMLVKVPTDWISAPSRLLMPDNAADRLHNALLDAGVEDWIDIRIADDGVNLTAELLDTLNLGQLAALKVGYDIPLHDLAQPVYTFAERNSVVETSAPLVDPAKAMNAVRQRFAGMHTKVSSIEATDDPRVFVVGVTKAIPMDVGIGRHGLVLIETEGLSYRVRIDDAVWVNLLKASAPVRPVEQPADQQSVDTEAKTETAEVPMVEAPPAPAETDAEITRLRIELARAEDRIAALQTAIRALTPAANEWKTLRLPVRTDGSKGTPHPEIAEHEALGWKVNQFLVDAGDLLVVMKREATAPTIQPIKYASVGALSMYGHGEPVSPVNGSARYDAMIQEMDAELAPIADALKASFQRMVVMNG